MTAVDLATITHMSQLKLARTYTVHTPLVVRDSCFALTLSRNMHVGVTGLVTHNKLRSSSLVGCEVVCVLSEGREEAFSQNPNSISSSESDRECWGSGAGRAREVQI